MKYTYYKKCRYWDDYEKLQNSCNCPKSTDRQIQLFSPCPSRPKSRYLLQKWLLSWNDKFVQMQDKQHKVQIFIFKKISYIFEKFRYVRG